MTNASAYWQTIIDGGTPENPSIVSEVARKMINHYLPLLEKEKRADHFSALGYAFYLYADAALLMKASDEENNHLICCSLMLAAEECLYAHNNNWSYGARQLYELKKAGISLPRVVVAAFLAQEGNWSNRNKSDLLEGNTVAVGIYCARLRTLCRIFLGQSCTCGSQEQVAEVLSKLDEIDPTKPDEILAHFLNEYAVPYLESCGSQAAQKQVAAFQYYLKSCSDFYTAPCSTKYHLSRDGGLVEHTIHVLSELIRLTVPATKEQLGACVLAAIGHDLCKVNVYRKQHKSKKVYLAEGDQVPEGTYVKTDNGGRFYWMDDYYYEFSDTMPFGHGRKSAYMLMGFFPEIGEEVFAAVDAHMGDTTTNPRFMEHYSENLLALNLHLADVLAACITEA